MKLKILTISLLLVIAAASAASAQVTNPNLKTAQSVALANAPDVTITNISRVPGEDKLKITVANQGKMTANNVKLRIYALPYGHCSKMQPYTEYDEKTGYCAANPPQIPGDHWITSATRAKLLLGLAWTSVSLDPFDLAAGASTEQTVKFQSQPVFPVGYVPKKFFPMPYLKQGDVYLYAPYSILKFDLSVFYAVVEIDPEANKTNNDYFFNIRQRGK